MGYKYICNYCRIEFISKSKNRKFCSQKCFGKWRTENYIKENNSIYKERDIKKCKVCEKEFKCRIDSKKKYCSHKCYWEGLKGRPKKNRKGKLFSCIVCGKKVYKSPNSKKKYCSRECYLVNHSKNTRTVKCKICNKKFIISRITKNGDYYCSRKCYLTNHSKVMISFICPICKKEFKQSKGLTQKRLCCSKKCAMKYINQDEDRNKKIGNTLLRKYKTGEKISWSKGFTCKTDDRINKMSITILEGYQNGRVVHNKGTSGPGPYCDAWADKEYKEDIKNRDNYKCQDLNCRGISKVLCIHHIDYDKRNCHPNNLITLCKSCHSKTNFNRDYWQKLYENKVVVNG